MGKSIKKLVSKVKKFTEKVDPLGAGTLNKIVDPIADQYLGTDFTGAKAQAAEDAANAANRQDALLNQLRNQAASANVDLGLENTPVAEVGGTATSMSRKRRTGNAPRAGAGVAASLGINV